MTDLTDEQEAILRELDAAIDAAEFKSDTEFFAAVAAKDDYLEILGVQLP